MRGGGAEWFAKGNSDDYLQGGTLAFCSPP